MICQTFIFIFLENEEWASCGLRSFFHNYDQLTEWKPPAGISLLLQPSFSSGPYSHHRQQKIQLRQRNYNLSVHLSTEEISAANQETGTMCAQPESDCASIRAEIEDTYPLISEKFSLQSSAVRDILP